MTYRVSDDGAVSSAPHGTVISAYTGALGGSAPRYRLHNGVVQKKNSSNDAYETAPANSFYIQHSLTPGRDVILGDNYSAFDLQIYGKYYESVAACELQPQKSKRMYIRGGLVDFSYDTHKVLASSVIPVPDFMQVKMAPTRAIKHNFVDEHGVVSSAVVDTRGATILNGAGYGEKLSSSTQGKRRLEATDVE